MDITDNDLGHTGGNIPQQDPPCATDKAGELSNSNDLLFGQFF